MKRLFTLMLLAGLFAFAGCESDKSSSPVANDNQQIDLFLPESAVVGAAGVEVVVPIRVQVTDDGGVSANVPLTFRVLNGPGVLTSRTAETDDQGLAVSTLRATLPRGSGKTTIGVYTGTSSAQGDITFKGTGLPTTVTIGSPPDNLYAPTGAPVKVNLHAQLTDADGFGVAGVPLKYGLIGPDGPAVGSVSGDSASRADGSIQFTYDVFCNGLREEITISTDTTIWKGAAVSDTASIQVKTVLSQINSLQVTAMPNVIDLATDSLGHALIRALVRDRNGVGIPNIVVHFMTNLGVLTGVTPTDADGVATADFWCVENGVATITVSIPGTPFQATIAITVRQPAVLTGRIDVSSDVDFIYADNGLTSANLTITLKDGEDQAMVGKQVTLHCAFGAVNSPVRTDSLGVARAEFVDQGVPSYDNEGNLRPVKIYAKYRPMNLVDSCEVTIRPSNPVTTITLVANKLILQAGSGDSSMVRATCFVQSGAFAPPGTTVRFEVDQMNGQFTESAVPVGQFGVAETYYIAGNFVGVALLRASVVNEGGGNNNVAYSNEVHIALVSGPPASIRLRAEPNVLNCNDPGVYSTISANVTDTSGNPVRPGELVRFSTTLGEIIPSGLSDSVGAAHVRLVPGMESGVAIVTGRIDLPGGGSISATCNVTFISGLPNVIELTADPLQIAVAGTGGITNSTLRATVKDANGNLVERSAMVVFQVLNNPDQPLGCNINNHGSIDSSRTANGISVVTLNSGTQIGGKLIRAYTWRDPDSSTAGLDNRPRTDTVSVVLSTVSVVAGPPFQLDIDVNAEGEDAGGGIWQVEVSARVWDVHRNPAYGRIPVNFTVDPQVATIDPAFAENGVAHTYLRYNSINTYTPVTISADIQTVDGLLQAERAWVLPLQRGRIELSADPGNLMFDRQRPNDTLAVEVWAFVTDGHGVEINNAPVLFTSDRAAFFWRNLRLNGRYIPFFPNPVRRYTGLVNQENNEDRGVATVYLRGVMNDFFLDDFALEATVRIEARVEGADGVEAEPVNVRVTRR